MNLCHATKVNPFKIKGCQQVLATAVAYHLIQHDKSMPLLVSGYGRER